MNKKSVDRDQFIQNQKNLCTHHGWPFFMPTNGVCWKCNGDIVATLISQGKNGSEELVTGCPLCSRSYCD